MERQKSFSLKPMKFLALSFTVSSSLLFCFLFSLWVFDITPSGSTEPHSQFRAASRSDFSGNLTKGPALRETHVAGVGNFSGGALDSTMEVKDAILAHSCGRGGSDSSKKEADVVNSEKGGIFNGATQLERTCSEAGELICRLVEKIGSNSTKKCDIYDGKWVYDESYPLYRSKSCPFIDEGFNCEANGRVDLGFMKWRWQPHHCSSSIPRVNYYQEGHRVHPRLDVSTAFRKALTTWASWVDQHVNPRKTQVFFRSSSPSHFSGGEWNSGGHCRESTRPLNDTSERQVPFRNLVLDQVVKQMRTSVTILNITNLSGLRIDGHPSMYGNKFEKIAPQSSIQDCSHWCLPGVPDTWNELLYFHLISHHKPLLAS